MKEELRSQAAEPLTTAASTDFVADIAQDIAGQVKAVRKVAKRAVRATGAKVRDQDKTSKSARTREKILAAAGDLIHETGSTDFQMSDVATRCNMSKGSLYYYFPDRDAIVEEIFSRFVDEFATKLETVVANSRSAGDALRNLCVVFCESVRDGGFLVSTMVSELARGGTSVLPRLETRFSRIISLVAIQIERAQHERVIREGIDPNFTAAGICGAIILCADQRISSSQGDLDVEALANDLIDLFLSGIAAS